ncbi:hypothetical protein NKH18_26840 [Streptomyces sp. M10(2022)]
MEPVLVDGSYQQEPLLPRWLPRALITAAVLLIALAAIWYALLRPAVKSAAREAVTPEAVRSAAAAERSDAPDQGDTSGAGAGAGSGSGGGSGGGDSAGTGTGSGATKPTATRAPPARQAPRPPLRPVRRSGSGTRWAAAPTPGPLSRCRTGTPSN